MDFEKASRETLALIVEPGEISQVEVIKHFLPITTEPQTYAVIRRMEALGLLTKRVSGSTRVLTITPAGRKMAASMAGA